MKYVYCLARNVPSIPDTFPPGLGGAEVHLISFRRISALVSDVGTKRLVGNEQNALAHQEVVDAVLRLSKSVIPCRFGTLLSDDENILILLREHYARLDAHLTRLQGKIEVSVQTIFNREGSRGSAPVPAPPKTSESEESEKPLMGKIPHTPEETPGVSYLLKKKEQSDAIKKLEGKADRLSQELNQAMSPFWSEVKVQKATQDEKLLLSLCYLVDQQNLSSFKLAYHKFKRENPGLRLLYTGPWAPYTFADIDLKIASR